MYPQVVPNDVFTEGMGGGKKYPKFVDLKPIDFSDGEILRKSCMEMEAPKGNQQIGSRQRKREN